MFSQALCVLIYLSVFANLIADGLQNDSCSTVHLIHVVPSSDNEELSGWNKTELYVLQSAKQLALSYINSRSDLLPGIKLEIVDVSTDDCSRDSSMQDFAEAFKLIVSKRKCILGIIGLYCSSVTNTISSILSHDNFGYIQLSAATSPLLRNRKRFPYLYRTLSSSVVFNRAVLEMMKKYSWTNVSLVYDLSDTFFRSTAENFIEQVREEKDFKLKNFFPIRASGNHEILQHIVRNESRVTYFSVTHKESSDILCDAYHHNYSWPDHVYIFVDDSLDEILIDTGKCTREEILEASDHVIFLLNKLNNSREDFISGINYENYKRERNVSIPTKIHGMEDFANVLYDQIWAMTFAINNSMMEINCNLTQSVQSDLLTSSLFRNIVAKELTKLNFEGVSSKIAFTERQEVINKIDFFQILNKQQVYIGEYDPYTNTTDVNITNAPKGYYEVRHDAIPVWLGVLVALFQALLVIMFILTVVYIMYMRKAPEIKSMSLLINCIILMGCLMVMVSSLFYNLENFSESSKESITAFCILESWLFLSGISIILQGLLFRLMRVFIIFNNPNDAKTQFLTDKFLFLYFLLTFLVPFLFQLIWTAADHLTEKHKREFRPLTSDTHYTEHFYCSSNYLAVWLSLYGAWLGAILVVLMVLAIQTRHIKYSNFKDTKKIGAFVFMMVFMLTTLFPTSLLLQEDVPVGSYVLKSLLTTVIPSSCLLLQYFPKLFPVLSKQAESHISSNFATKIPFKS